MIRMWAVATTEEFDDWFASLTGDDQAELIAKVALLKHLGPQLSRPHADTLKGSRYANMKELRAGTRSSVLRVAFAFDPDRQAILLIGGDKAGVNERRFYRQLIARAEELFDRHLARLRAKRKTRKDPEA
jgi:hypothetical protein